MGIALLKILLLLLLDAAFIGVLALALWPVLSHRKATAAVLKRNFIGYFSNPTGYVFLCLFVLLTSFAAFWPHEFFTDNLANLNQLNKYLPYIMLVFIPAITMSIWAEERSKGTDELLLTLPAADFDIVFGKYLAAAAIFTASLIFSQISNYAVLVSLTYGDLDTGLFFSTYFGYWLVGLAMLSVGMVASFLTSNLTVGFILGAAFNAPLAFAAQADVIIPSTRLARAVAFWSLAYHFDDPGRGVISLASIIYFLLIAVLGLYLSMVLIGARHWSGGRDGHSMLGHYLLRTMALLVISVSLVIVVNDHNYFARYDATAGRVSSLSAKTKEIIRNLEPSHTIYVDAFVSAQVPEAYVQTKYSLVSLLKEFDALSGGKIKVRLYDNLETFSDEAVVAEERYGIKPTLVRTRSRGAFKDQEIILGAAFSCGLEKVVVPFFDYGIPVEYELIRSIGTVAQGQRKKIGVLRTDAQLFGGFSFAGGMPRQIPKQELIEELEKQYDVEEVDANNPIEVGKYDVLLAVQPSSLSPEQFTNFVDAVRAGQPTAIFEDPMPIFMRSAPGTGEPKQAPGGMFGGQGPQPKGDIQQLWEVIGLDVPGEPSFMGGYNPDIAWQRYNPYPKLQIQGIPDAWIFASNEAPGGEDSLNQADPITAGLTEILFPVPGVVRPKRDRTDLEFTTLVQTGDFAGTIAYEKFQSNQDNPMRMIAEQGRPRGPQILAVRIQGKPETASDESDTQGGEKAEDEGASGESAASGNGNGNGDEPSDDGAAATEDSSSENKGGDEAADSDTDDKETADEDAGTTESSSEEEPERTINVIYVTDIDLMIDAFLRIRARPEEDEEITWRFENVNFLLNIVDSLSGDDQYIEIRRRKPHYSTLKVVEAMTRIARDKEFNDRLKFEEDFKKAIEEAEAENKKALKEFQDRVDDLKKKQEQGEDVSLADVNAAAQALAIKQQELSQKLEVTRERLERDRDKSIERIRRETDLEILKIQNQFKFWAVAIPPIPPMIVGLIVFVARRLREREGISKSRLR